MQPRARSTPRLLGVAVAAVLAAAACGSTAPTDTPLSPSPASSATSAVAGHTSSPGGGPWLIGRVEEPTELEAQPSNAPVFCSPCHPVTAAYMDALALPPGGGYVALGHDRPPNRAAAWATTDGMQWSRLVQFPAPDDSQILGATSSADSLVAVGGSGAAAAVWHSADGLHWTITTLDAPPHGNRELLTAVARAAPNGGYVAGGYEENGRAEVTATLWRSADGSTWSRSAADPSFAGSQVTGVAAGPNAAVAVGYGGGNREGHAVAWRSTDGGATWQASGSSGLGDGRMLALAFDGSRFVAVGESKAADRGMVWTSTDGLDWTTVTDQPALDHYGDEVYMAAVAASPNGGFVADGWQSDAANGSVIAWRSRDGTTWSRLPSDPSFSGGGASAILAGPKLVIAGTKGWPDTHAAMAWLAPEP